MGEHTKEVSKSSFDVKAIGKRREDKMRGSNPFDD
jgi:hypothetical protein